ncbi:MAG: sulfotransferase [Proteobacteria bacterium]|nr:sulfotransferase [Pseudomonadota bacterium]MCP4920466.1 sulfotransferase [Pseudomonadota bacterium]
MSRIFIGGAGRSGTTLLVDLLGLHPNLSPIYETDFVVFCARLLSAGVPTDVAATQIAQFMEQWTRGLPHRPHNKRAHERFVHGPHHILFGRDTALRETRRFCDAIAVGREVEGFRNFLDSLFGEHTRLDGKTRWINKTPAYVRMLPVLQQVYPDMKFIHCVRDGRDVVASIVTRPFGPSKVDEAARWWAGSVQAGIQFANDNPECVREVRYEDLLRDPVRTLEPLLGWLGEEGAASMLGAHSVGLDPSRAGAWRASFSANDASAFDSEAGGLLDRLGYAA